MLYLVNNFENCYNVYLTREKAEKAVETLKAKGREHYTEKQLNKHYYITEIQEGQTFGFEVGGDSDVFVE